MSDREARDEEREALEALLVSPGWRLIREYIDKNWGPRAYRERCRREVTALPKVGEMEALAQLSVLQVEAVTAAMELLERWPVERAKTLAVKKDQKTRGRGIFGRGATPNE